MLKGNDALKRFFPDLVYSSRLFFSVYKSTAKNVSCFYLAIYKKPGCQC